MKYAALAIALLVLSSAAFAVDTSWSGVELRTVPAAPAFSLTRSLSLYAAVHGTLAPSFHVAEGMVPGNATAALELRLSLPSIVDMLPGQLQLVGFLDNDSGGRRMNGSSMASDRRTIGGGFGLNWFQARRFAVKGTYAHKLGNDDLTVAPDTSNRFWLNVVKYY